MNMYLKVLETLQYIVIQTFYTRRSSEIQYCHFTIEDAWFSCSVFFFNSTLAKLEVILTKQVSSSIFLLQLSMLFSGNEAFLMLPIPISLDKS